MKFIILFSLMAVSKLVLSQEIEQIKLPLKESAVIYEEIVVTKDTSISAGAIYDAAQTWFANTFKNSKAVLKVEDRGDFKLIGKGSSLYKPHSIDPDEYITYSMQVDAKKGKYRFRIYDMAWDASNIVDIYHQSIDSIYSQYLDAFLKNPKKANKSQGGLLRFTKDTAQGLIVSLKNHIDNYKQDDF